MVCSSFCKVYSSSWDLLDTSQQIAYNSMSHQVFICSARASSSEVVTQDAGICTASCCGSRQQRAHPSLVFTAQGSPLVQLFLFWPMYIEAVLSQNHFYIFEFQSFFAKNRQEGVGIFEVLVVVDLCSFVYVWISVDCHVVCVALCLATECTR